MIHEHMFEYNGSSTFPELPVYGGGVTQATGDMSAGRLRRAGGWLWWSLCAASLNAGAFVVAVVGSGQLGGPLVLLSLVLLASTFVAGVVLTAMDGSRRQVGVGLLTGAIVTAVLLLGWLALSIHDLDVNGVA